MECWSYVILLGVQCFFKSICGKSYLMELKTAYSQSQKISYPNTELIHPNSLSKDVNVLFQHLSYTNQIK